MQSDHVDDLARLVDDFTRHKMNKLSIVAWEEVGAERDGYADLVKFLDDRVRMLKSSMLLEVPPGSSILKMAGTKGSGTVDKPSKDSATN
uniref:Uncharacterized protein n=1 Tax=Anopheles funestus TaxID=62324 RepID=A0A182RUD7_ANOFN